MSVSRGGLESGEKDFVTLGGGLAHSPVMEEGSRVPRCFSDGRDVLIKEGAWISLYAVEASRPAYRWITERLVKVGKARKSTYCLHHLDARLHIPSCCIHSR